MLKLTELTCSGSSPVQVAGLVLLLALTIGLHLWGTVQSVNQMKGDNMKKKNISLTSLNAKLRALFVSVILTIHAILTSFLGGSPMLA